MATKVNNLAHPTTLPSVEEKKKISLYDREDIDLAKVNAYQLALGAIIASSNYHLAAGLTGIFMVGSYVQQYRAYQAIPPSAPFIDKLMAHPLFPLIGLFNPTIPKIQCIATFCGIVKNSAAKLFNCFRSSKDKKVEALSAAALHIFNTAAQGYFTKHHLKRIDVNHEAFEKFVMDPDLFVNSYFHSDNRSFEDGTDRYNDEYSKRYHSNNNSNYDDSSNDKNDYKEYKYDKDYWENFYRKFEEDYRKFEEEYGRGRAGTGTSGESGSTHPSTDYEKMSTIDRLNSDLDPNRLEDAFKLLMVKPNPECSEAIKKNRWYTIDAEGLQNACAGVVQAAKRAFRKIGLIYHPDKRHPDPLAKPAFLKAANAQETIVAKLSVKDSSYRNE